MLLAIELFLVSNASDIQSPGATTQSFQIVLKRYVVRYVPSCFVCSSVTKRLVRGVIFSWLRKRILVSNLILVLFFFNDTATTEIYTLSLHDALPIFLFLIRVAEKQLFPSDAGLCFLCECIFSKLG